MYDFDSERENLSLYFAGKKWSLIYTLQIEVIHLECKQVN